MESDRQGTIDPALEIRRRSEIARKALGRWTRRVRGALERTVDPAEANTRAEQGERVARTLLAHMGSVPRGADHATLPDYSGDGTGVIEIALDPALGARENAERMLREARKARRGAAMIPQRKAQLETEIEEILRWTRQIEPQAESVDRRDERSENRRLGRVLDDLEARLLPRGLWPSPPRLRERPPEREPVRWTLEGGWILMAGRSGTENDFLTTRIARPDDLWFHVANVPGAHVVLRSPDGKSATPSPALVERAAALAAWLSRMRAQDRVEVRYTERKRVRKPRKAPAGTVAMDQSRSILVKPAPPPRTDGTTKSSHTSSSAKA